MRSNPVSKGVKIPFDPNIMNRSVRRAENIRSGGAERFGGNMDLSFIMVFFALIILLVLIVAVVTVSTVTGNMGAIMDDEDGEV